MTDILIIHNPFIVETIMCVDGVEISATSGLYKYIKTPMQDWVGNFLPTLVEHCNDDELNITFRGLQHNYEDLEAEVTSFLKKNSDYEIELSFDECKSLKERLAEINTLSDEIKSQNLIPELYEIVFEKMYENEKLDCLQVVAFSANGLPCTKIVDELLHVNTLDHNSGKNYCYTNYTGVTSDVESGKEGFFKRIEVQFPFAGSDLCPIKFYEVNEWKDGNSEANEFLKTAISTYANAIFICVVEDIYKKNNTEIMELISEAYKTRGKQNKWRFIFVSENPQIVRKLLNSDFSVKNAVVYGMDEIVLIFKRIEEYQNEFYMVRHLKYTAEKVYKNLVNIENKINFELEGNEKVEDIDRLEKEVLNLLDKCKQEYFYEDISINDKIDQLYKQLWFEYNQCLKKVEEKSNGWEEHYKYVKDKFSNHLICFINDNATKVYCKKVHVISERLIDILYRLGCDNEAEYLADLRPINSCVEYLDRTPNYKKIVDDFWSITMEEFCEKKNTYEGQAIPVNINFKLYPFNILGIFHNTKHAAINATEYSKYIKKQEEVFITQIRKSEQLLIAYVNSFIKQIKEQPKKEDLIFIKKKKEIAGMIMNRVDYLRKEAESSAVEKEKKTYIQTLCRRVEDVILLKGGDINGNRK